MEPSLGEKSRSAIEYTRLLKTAKRKKKKKKKKNVLLLLLTAASW